MFTVSTKLNNITIGMLTHRPSSFSLPRWRQECKANVISVIASANFFWINWFWAKGLPNCFRSIVYCRAISTQAYDGEGIYQVFERTKVNGNRFKNWPNPKAWGTYVNFLYHTSAAPIAPHEIPYRALLRHPKGPANPETLGSMLVAGTKTSSIKIIPVCDALRENFPSI